MNHLVSSVPSVVGRLLFLFIGYSCAALGGLLPKLWLRFSALLGAKLLSYFCSAVLHLYPHPSVEIFNVWLRMDLVGICFAVWAPTSVFLDDARLWLLHFACACAVAGSTHRLIDSKLANASESDLKRLDRKRTLRTVINTLYFLWCLVLCGIGYDFQHLWIIGAVIYSIGFFLAPPFSRRYPDMPWHFKGLNGWHEDFHLTVALADLAFIMMAYDVLQAAE
ncbi:unnamed protein product [Durusdinium trenchii]|uniref:Uncharacterized protein n=2 Tax=Durusdinium trenchii TaxID=1381693 RepID=A0ABP0LZM6_9DINO